MIRYPTALRTHLAQGVTTTCQAWRLTRRDGRMFGFTDHDLPLAFDGTDFKPMSGFSASEAVRSLGLATDSVDVEGALSSDDLVSEEIEAGLFDDATVETILVNWRDPSQFAMTRKASIGKMVRSDGRFVAELKSAMHSLDQPNARYLTRACDAELGDRRCGYGLNAATMTGAGVVVEDLGGDAFRVSGLGSFAADWFTHGVLTWTAGPRAGRSERIADHRPQGGDALLFLSPISGTAPEIGDTFKIVAGCDKAFGTCKTKFANQRNFRGFPHLPGNDAAYSYVTDGMVFDGKPVVP